MIGIPWVSKNSGFTLLFKTYTMLLVEKEMPVSGILKKCRN